MVVEHTPVVAAVKAEAVLNDVDHEVTQVVERQAKYVGGSLSQSLDLRSFDALPDPTGGVLNQPYCRLVNGHASTQRE
ncbi:MAG: hypothetical protein NW201_07795 [Gemmatimonadales bacterium]|nr:hypothetical protein [Gemmatimonadales bacterium]